jgi:protein-L-isoaspartate(D-aspartate) O-methyltransferase
VIVTAATPEIPEALAEQLAPGGTMILPIGRAADVQSLVRVRKGADGGLTSEDLMAVRFVPLLPGLPGVS